MTRTKAELLKLHRYPKKQQLNKYINFQLMEEKVNSSQKFRISFNTFTEASNIYSHKISSANVISFTTKLTRKPFFQACNNFAAFYVGLIEHLSRFQARQTLNLC